MGRLSGKVAIITGAARGMGEATARLFASEGAKVVLTDVLEDEGQAVAADIGDAASFIKHDVSSDDDWAAVVAKAKADHGTVDILVNNAGVVHFTPIEALSAEDAQHVLGINTIGPMLGIKHVSAVMKAAGKGSIVNISSVDGLRGCNGLTIYTASKWALRGLTKSLAYELGTSGIRVNSVHPGGVDTPMGNARDLPADQLNAAFGRVPLQRIGQPEEIAQASLFLATDEASYITGAEIAVDGGWSSGYFQPVLPGAPEGMTP
ncbi:SDR family NAD(P)-dependent oxidoreductase [Parasphingorhabdus halotolerans]|uniref:Glucose 1-dehydrogenase n=1 Tax=Parasphingorhabdus halotolerans TaxID=2725558 RepID=A0A6H2DM67_9SPHN|nr:glucose 1-dehydrogenase [Parasphingorhabdus halotolerans]QJB68756.1 glucose 1-dehydrogenase [Parasphingorhabdus halotolerans]